MLYLSWDIGIKNLSYCLLDFNEEENKYKILNWEIINLVEDNNEVKYKCQKIMKKKNEEKICNKSPSKYNKITDEYLCNMHCKKVANKDLVIINKVICSNEKCIKKITYETDNSMIGYCTIHSNKIIKNNEKGKNIINLKKIVKKNKSLEKKNEMDRISKILIYELDKREFLLKSNIVLIENQPALKNPKMKSIQMIIYTYFLIRGIIDKKDKMDIIDKIQFLLASNKLKVEFDSEIKNKIIQEINNKTKDKYKRHKELAKKYCLYYLENNIENKLEWVNFFNSHKKKDDLADTFLMNIYRIQNK